MRKLLYVVCALALLGGFASGCSDNAKADSPVFGEYLGTTASGSMVSRFQDNATVCYVARADRGLVSPPAISCVRE